MKHLFLFIFSSFAPVHYRFPVGIFGQAVAACAYPFIMFLPPKVNYINFIGLFEIYTIESKAIFCLCLEETSDDRFHQLYSLIYKSSSIYKSFTYLWIVDIFILNLIVMRILESNFIPYFLAVSYLKLLNSISSK